MKRCPTCNQTYTDENLSFCIEDGTPLVPLVVQNQAGTGTPPVKQETAAERPYGTAPTYQPPSAYVPPGGGAKRRVWPWVVGIIGLLCIGIVGVVGIILTTRILIPSRPIVEDRRVPASNSNLQSNNNGPVNANANANVNSNLANENSTSKNTNIESGAVTDSAAPTDTDTVLAQLTDLENEWTAANLNADKKKLEDILADDYVGPSGEGKSQQGKAEYIRTIQRDNSVEKWDLNNLKLSLKGDRAILTGSITYHIDGKDVVFNFTDKFVWRDGRWQATGSQVESA